MKWTQNAWAYSLIGMLIPVSLALATMPKEIKISFAFHNAQKPECQMALTPDSVGVLALDTTAFSMEPDDENDFSDAPKKRALSISEKDTATILLNMTHAWKGSKRFNCDKEDGYAFSIWSDSLSLHCNNCFSCSEGVGLQEAKTLVKFGKMTLWLYKIGHAMP